MLHKNTFRRRVGNDVNRAVAGEELRRYFLRDYDDARIAPSLSNDLLAEECSWFEMLVALSTQLDYLYEGGIRQRFLELVSNLGLRKILATRLDAQGTSPYDEVDQELVDMATGRVDESIFDINGHGGLFPLRTRDHRDQREVEIWSQQAMYFRERLEGEMWTSIS